MRVERLVPCRETEDFIARVWLDPHVAKAHTDDHLGISHLIDLINGYRDGTTSLYFAFDGDTPVGIMFTYGFMDGWLFGGHYFLKGYNWAFAIKAVKTAMGMVHEDFPNAFGCFGIIAEDNTLSQRVAIRSGYKCLHGLPTTAIKAGRKVGMKLYHYDLQGLHNE